MPISSVLHHIPADSIVRGVEVQNVRSRVDTESIVGLAESIYANGLASPLTVWMSDGAVHLVAGFRRLAAMEYIRTNIDELWSTADERLIVPVQFLEGTLQDALDFNVLENVQRESLSIIDLATRIHKMATEDGVAAADIAQRLAITQERAEQSIAVIEGGCPGLLSRLGQGGSLGISLSAAYELVSLYGKDEQEKRLAKFDRAGEKVTAPLVATDSEGNVKLPGAKAKRTMLARAEGRQGPAAEMAKILLGWVMGTTTEDAVISAMQAYTEATPDAEPPKAEEPA